MQAVKSAVASAVQAASDQVQKVAESAHIPGISPPKRRTSAASRASAHAPAVEGAPAHDGLGLSFNRLALAPLKRLTSSAGTVYASYPHGAAAEEAAAGGAAPAAAGDAAEVGSPESYRTPGLHDSDFLGLHTVRLDDVEFIERRGRGDYGEVWRVRVLGSGVEMAVKKVHEGLVNAEAHDLFLKEAQLMSSVRHPNVIRVFGGCVSPSAGLHLFMELCEGAWRDRLNNAATAVGSDADQGEAAAAEEAYAARGRVRSGPLDALVTAHVLRCVARGLAHLHRQGIVHRDVKTENIMLRDTSELDDEYAAIGDMGLARYAGQATEQMTVRGTTWIMAPEMLQGRPYNKAVDVFSYGVCMVESLTLLLAEDVPRTNRFLVDWAAVWQCERIVKSGARPLGSVEVGAGVDSADGAEETNVARLLDIAASCCREDPDARPSFEAVDALLTTLIASVQSSTREC